VQAEEITLLSRKIFSHLTFHLIPVYKDKTSHLPKEKITEQDLEAWRQYLSMIPQQAQKLEQHEEKPKYFEKFRGRIP
jgi:hypothetical protein